MLSIPKSLGQGGLGARGRVLVGFSGIRGRNTHPGASGGNWAPQDSGHKPGTSNIRGSSHLSWSQLHCFEDPTGVFFFFSGFPPAAAVLRMTTRGRAVPTVLNGATGEGRGHPGVMLGVPLPPTQLAPFIIRLQFHNVSCSEAGGVSETLSLTHSAAVKTITFAGISENSLNTAFTSHYGHKYFCSLILFVLFDPFLFCPTPV